jgi:hypothetical protein
MIFFYNHLVMNSDAKLTIAPIEEIASAMQNMRRSVEHLLSPIEQSVNYAAAIAKFMTGFHINFELTTREWMAQQKRLLQDWMAHQQIDLSRTAELMAFALECCERYRREEEPETSKLLSDSGWLGMHRHFCLDHLREAVTLYKTQGEKAMNDAIIEHFNTDGFALLEQMSEMWLSIPYLRDRKDIIRDALDAHKQGKFTLSIPALLPMVDGLAAEVLGNQSMKAIALLANERRANDPEVWAQGFCDFVSRVYYKGYEFGKDEAPFLSRHGILHGRVFDYPSALNSTRVFLLIDAVADIWHEKQKAIVTTTIQ